MLTSQIIQKEQIIVRPRTIGNIPTFQVCSEHLKVFLCGHLQVLQTFLQGLHVLREFLKGGPGVGHFLHGWDCLLGHLQLSLQRSQFLAQNLLHLLSHGFHSHRGDPLHRPSCQETEESVETHSAALSFEALSLGAGCAFDITNVRGGSLLVSAP